MKVIVEEFKTYLDTRDAVLADRLLAKATYLKSETDDIIMGRVRLPLDLTMQEVRALDQLLDRILATVK